ncbi:DUF3899 domain-containing protein [Radiobacillus deserti]|uniref:DUF3899 domain-containing protein n=1 Tax=Radiobacillus deserti TaxID=2594883 RepID=UPI001E3CEDF8|nr:DUF3899 domain-containing protein [Radiobacillus deserti]
MEGYIDAIFSLSLLYIMFALFLFILRGRFFDGVTYGFRRFIHRMGKNKDLLDEFEKKPLPSDMINMNFYKAIVYQATLTAIVVGSLLCLYYLF